MELRGAYVKVDLVKNAIKKLVAKKLHELNAVKEKLKTTRKRPIQTPDKLILASRTKRASDWLTALLRFVPKVPTPVVE